MTLKDYINKEQLITEEQEQLIDKLYELSEEENLDAFFNVYIEDVPSNIKKIIEKEGLEDADMPIVRIFQVNGKLEYDGISVKFECGE